MIKWIILGVVIIVISIITIKRGYFFKVKKTGEKLSTKEFMTRWKQGINGITPLQISKSQVMGTWITMIGIICGIVTTAIVRIANMWWWMEIILIASLFLTSLSQVSNIQKRNRLIEVDDALKQMKGG